MLATPEFRSEQRRVARELARFSGFGLAWALSVLFFLLIGYWLDGRLGTLPWLTIVGAFVGAAGGFISLYKGVMDATREDRESSGR